MERRANCPFCDPPDTNRHLYYNDEKEAYFCFRCGKRGIGLPPGLELDVEHKRPFLGIKLTNAHLLSDLFQRPVPGMAAQAARAYLLRHHCDPDRIAFERRLLLQGSELIFPVYKGKEMVFWQKRNVFIKQFVNPPVESKPVFWTDDVTEVPVFLCESFLNACRIDKFVTACAIFGKFLSDEAALEIRNRAKSVHVLLDSAEYSAGMKIVRKLKQVGVKQTTIRMISGSPGTDVCDLNDIAVAKLLRMPCSVQPVRYTKRDARPIDSWGEDDSGV